MIVHVATNGLISKLLDIDSRLLDEAESPPRDDFAGRLKSILVSANDFVPSESGSILLSEAILGRDKPGDQDDLLCFVACYGHGSSKVAGLSASSKTGIAGRAYTTGEPFLSEAATEDTCFFPEIDRKTRFTTRSMICMPIKLNGVPIGIIELMNKTTGESGYNDKDLHLLEFFADYVSTLIRSSLDTTRLKSLTTCDDLTKLYNNRYFSSMLETEVAAALSEKTDLSLVFVGIDRFRRINDRYGYLAASRTLSEVAAMIASIKSDKEVFISRYGGDEFVITMPGCDLDEAHDFAEVVRHAIAETPFFRQSDRKKDETGPLTASLGISSLRKSVDRSLPLVDIIKDLVRKADKAMQMSKEDGRNRTSTAGQARTKPPKGSITKIRGHA